jgi:YVTN family beta-propeller protein
MNRLLINKKFIFLSLFFMCIILIGSSKKSQDRIYVGEKVCRKCHHLQGNRNQYNPWRASKHAKAYVSLFKPEAKEIAELSGIDIEPFKSPICLGCHTTAYNEEEWERDPSFHFDDGIQCEQCHGPGSEYIDVNIMSDREKTIQAGLKYPKKRDCLICHKEKNSHVAVLHTSEFDYEMALQVIQHRGRGGPLNLESDDPPDMSSSETIDYEQMWLESLAKENKQKVEYKTPFNLAITKDGNRLFVACEASNSMIVVHTVTDKILAEILIGMQPHHVCLSPDEDRVYVSNRASDNVSVIDTETYEVLSVIDVGDEPHEMAITPDGKKMYVANAGTYDVSVVDISKGMEIKRLAASRGPWGATLSHDGKSVYISNNLPRFGKFRTTSKSEITVIDTKTSTVKHRLTLVDANLLQGIAVAPDDEFVITTLIRTKNLVPMTRNLQGWIITNGIGIIWPDGHVDQLLLDQVNDYFADPTDAVFSKDGKYLFVSGGGVQEVAMIDVSNMKKVLEKYSEYDRKNILPNHLGISTEYVLKRIPVGQSPRGMVVSNDNKYLYVADGLDDAVSVIDIAQRQRIKVIDLGGPEEITQARYGERIFHSADITYVRQFSCHSCHPDGGIDGLTYDIEPDGLGINPVDNRTLRGINDTAPFKWTGKNPSLQRQCGPRLAAFFTRIDPFTPEQSAALDRYIVTIPRPPNRYRTGDDLTPAQRRGKKIFERIYDNSGYLIPEEKRCDYCHSYPYFTSRENFNVGTSSWLDTGAHDSFDVPHLNNIYATPPYLHDGRASTLDEIWTIYNPKDKHGLTNDLTKDQLNDLIEFLKTL